MPGNAVRVTANGVMATGRGVMSAYKWTSESITTQRERPAVAREYRAHLWEEAKLEGRHYWMGSKLLAAEVRMSVGLLRQIASGIELTRRERQLLRRIMGDMVRMVPLIVILIVPFAELALPVLLKVFPTFLPSQFQKNELRQDLYRRSLTARIELHGVLADVLADHTAAASKRMTGGTSGDAPSSSSSSSAALLKDVEAVRSGAQLDTSTIVRVASLFKDELTLDTLPHAQLVMLAKYVGLKPFVPDVILRSQLRKKIKEIKEDDVMLLAEGGGQRLTKAELKAACETRGMRAIGLTEQRYAEQLDEWLALSVKSQVPVTLLFLSRSLSLAVAPGAETVAPAGGAPSAWRAPVATDETAAALQESLSAIDQAVVAEMVIDNTVTPEVVTGVGISSGSGSSSISLASSSVNLVSTSNAPEVSTGSTTTGTPLTTAAIPQQKTRETAVLKLKLDALAYQESLIAAERESLHAAEALRQAQAESIVKAAAAASAAADPAREREAFALAAEASASATRAASAATAAETKHTAFVRLTSKGATSAAVAASAFSEVRAAANDEEIAKQLAPLALAGALLGKEKAALEALRAAPPVIAAASATEKYLQTKMSSLSSTIEREVKQAEASGMRGALVAADADKDGYLTLHELQAAAAKVAGKGATPPMALQALFERLDSRRSGQVAISDVLAFFEKADAKAAADSDADVTQISKK